MAQRRKAVRRRRRRWLAVAAAALLATTACGSTAQSGASGSALANNGGNQDGLSAPGTGGSSGGGLATTSTAGGGVGPAGTSGGGGAVGTTGATSGTAGGGGAGTTTGGAGGGGTTGGAGPAAPLGPGITPTTVFLGLGYCNDCATTNATLGAGGQNPGDTRRYSNAVIEDINAHGGVLGRKLAAVWHPVSASDDASTSQQAACERWTIDNKVIATAYQGEVVYQCAKKAGILALGTGGVGPVYARFPNMFAPGDTRLDRLGAVTVKAMVHAGWHKPTTKWPTGKIGLITWDSNDYHYSMDHGWLPALHAAGLKEKDVAYISVPQASGALADSSAAISSAVLAFQQQGIDHVFIADGPAGVFTGVGLTLQFLQNAKSQGYYPRYGFNTNNAPDYQNHPKDELSGMLAVDSADSEAKNDEGIALNPVRERCFALMRKQGLPVGDDATRSVALNACSPIWFFQAVLNRAQGTTLPYMIAAAESLGTSYRSPSSYGDRFSHEQHDSSALFRNSAFDDGCKCMKYASKPFEP
jgi:hypothetical protein